MSSWRMGSRALLAHVSTMGSCRPGTNSGPGLEEQGCHAVPYISYPPMPLPLSKQKPSYSAPSRRFAAAAKGALTMMQNCRRGGRAMGTGHWVRQSLAGVQGCRVSIRRLVLAHNWPLQHPLPILFMQPAWRRGSPRGYR